MSNEAGIKALRANHIRETQIGVTPADPDWLRFSDELDSVDWGPDANLFGRRAIGSPDVLGFNLGPESHEITVTYSMQKWLVDGSGNPLDAAGDGLLRDSAGGYLSTHSLLTRQIVNPAGGADGGGRRVYTYGYGGYLSRVRITGSPDSGDPSKVELTYTFKKARSYLVDQPSASDTITVRSTDPADTTQTLTVEDDGAGTSEGIALNGTTPVTSVGNFASIDAFQLDAETVGDVVIERTTGNVELARVYGSDTYQGIEGDLGLPLLGSGSFETALGTAFQTVLGSSLTRGGSALATNVMGISCEVENSLEINALTGTKIQAIDPGDRSIMFNGTVFSDRASHDDVMENLRAITADIVWTFQGGASARTVTVQSAALTSPGSRAYSKGEATMRRDNTFTGQGIAISTGT